MYAIESAMALDFVRRGSAIMAVILLAMIAIPLWIVIALDPYGALASNHEGVVLHVVFVWMMGLGAATAVIQSQGPIRRFFVRPISTARLVACQMILGMVATAAMYGCAAFCVNLGGAGWPIVGPTLFLATTVACILAVIWSLEGTGFGRAVGCTAVSLALAVWFSRCYGARLLGDWTVMWNHPTAAETLNLAGIAIAAYAVAVWGVARTRRGDLCDFASFWAWWERLVTRGSAPERFRSATAAQAWCNWREKLILAPAIILAVATLLVAGMWLAGKSSAGQAVGFLLGIPQGLFLLVIPLVFGLVVGNCGTDSMREMRHFLGTRPVSDSFLATALLRSCTTMLALAGATWLVGLALVIGLLWVAGDGEEVALAIMPATISYPLIVAVVLIMPLLAWTFTALMAALVATGRPRLWAQVLCGLFGMAILFAVAQQKLSPRAFEILSNGWFILCGGLGLAGTVWAFAEAYRRGHISSRTVIPAVAFWLAACAATLLALPGPFRWSVVALLFCAGSLAMSMLPLAAMPLAIAWNRHR